MTELDQVTSEIASYKHMIEQANKLAALSSNKDFKELILVGYLEDNAISLVNLLAHPAQQEPSKQAAIHRQMAGVGALNDYFRSIRAVGERAKESLVNAEEFRAELLRDSAGIK